MPLTEIKIRAAKARTEPYRLSDGRGLHLQVTPNGSRLWRFRYRHGGREGMISLGAYPEVSLKQARERREEARQQLSRGTNPSTARRLKRAGSGHTFAAMSEEWVHRQGFGASSIRRIGYLLEVINERIGSIPVAALSADEALEALQHIEGRGHASDARRARQYIGRILRYAKATRRGGSDVTADLRDALRAAAERHHPGITHPGKLAELLRAIDAYPDVGTAPVVAALKLMPLVFVRPGELYGMEWTEIDLEEGVWRVPDWRTKKRRPHLVPLARQAKVILEWIWPLTGSGRFVLPSRDDEGRHISHTAVPDALRTMGYPQSVQTAHGFRTTADTLLHELGLPHGAIKAQMQHFKRGVDGIYDLSQYLPWRRELMQIWADYLDALKTGSPASAAALSRSAIQAAMSRALHATVP